MRAVVYEGAGKVAIEEVEDARIEEPTDALMRITSSALCGSLRLRRDGSLSRRPGRIVAGTVRRGQLRQASRRAARRARRRLRAPGRRVGHGLARHRACRSVPDLYRGDLRGGSGGGPGRLLRAPKGG